MPEATQSLGPSWPVVLSLAGTAIGMALLSSLVGLRAKLENPLWWLLYAVWIAIVLATDAPAPFRTILFASILGGLMHGCVQSLLLPAYIQNNPWYADKMTAPAGRLRLQFLVMGVIMGAVFGALMGGAAVLIQRL